MTLNNLNFSVHVSPRGREKRIMQRRWPTCPGITPRWAGCHLHAYRITILSTTHPRVSGENSTAHLMPQPIDGSSPRGRGKRDAAHRHDRRHRLIPTWAGKTTSGAATRRRGWAHPRMGGENSGASGSVPPCVGSSPRGRGKRRMVLTTGWPVRLIPARAGKTNGGCERGRV